MTMFQKLIQMFTLRNCERLGIIFNTKEYAYFYDSGTGKIFLCNKVEAEILKLIFSNDVANILKLPFEKDALESAANNILYLISIEDILNTSKELNFVCLNDTIRDEISHNLQMMTLELTGACNLRCDYCIYNEHYEQNRNFVNNDMTFETAKKSIDYANEHSGKKISITFYGGEPLLRFDLIKKCVEYCKVVFKDKILSFSMTTNLTLLTEEIAEYLAKTKGFSVVCSLDGPQHIHDNCRKYPDGRGSYTQAILGMQNLVKAFEKENKIGNISISMVFTTPYLKEKMEEINSFYQNLSWLPAKIEKYVTYPSLGSYKIEPVFDSNLSKEYYIDPLGEWTHENFINRNVFSKKPNIDLLLKVHNRLIFKNANWNYGLNGNCIPGSRKIYVTYNGDFKVCERIGNSPAIGNIASGIDFNVIKTVYYDEYINKSIEKCKNCWAVGLCGICYANCYDSNGINEVLKDDSCELQRYYMTRALVYYHEIAEKNAKSLEFLNEYVFA